MTLAGLALAIGPLVDSAIICLENTHRHLGPEHRPDEAAFLGASEVAMPELVATLLHAAGAGAAGDDARHGRVPVPADGHGRRLRDDRGLSPVAVVRAARCARWLHGSHAARTVHGDTSHDQRTRGQRRRQERPARLACTASPNGKSLIETGIAGTSGCSTALMRPRR